MKTMLISLTNIQAMFRHKTLTICLLIAGLVTSFLSFNIMTGIVKNNINIAINKVNTSNTFSITNMDKQKLYKIQSFIAKYNENIKNVLYINTDLRNNPLVGWSGDPTKNDWMVFEEGHNFNGLDSKEIMISYGLYLKSNLDNETNEYLLFNDRYTVVGLINYAGNEVFRGIDSEYQRLYPERDQTYHLHSDDEDYNQEETEDDYEIDYSRQVEIVPLATFQNKQYFPNIIRLHFDGALKKEYKAIHSELIDLFGSESVIVPVEANIYYAPELIKQMVNAIVLIGISIINIVSLFCFLCKLRKRIFFVLYLVGCSKFKNCMIIFIEWVLIFTASFVLFLLLILLLNPLFEMIAIRLLLSTVYEALRIYLIGLFATGLLIIPTTRRIALGR